MKASGIRSPLVILLALALMVWGAGLADAQMKGTIKIATQTPLSGGQASVGEGIKLAVQLAIEQKKAAIEKLGFKVELVPYDDQAKPDVGVANAKNIIADKNIFLVIGHFNSGVAIPSSEVYKDVQLAMISPANTNPVVTDRNLLNVNRVCGRDDVQGEVGAKFAKEFLKAKTAYVVHDKTTYGQGVAEFFRDNSKKLGIDVAGFEGTEEKSNFDPIVTPIKAKNPDIVYFGGIYDQMAPFYKAVREKGVKSVFLAPDGADASDFVKIGGKAVVGTYYTTAAGPVAMYPKAKEFAKTYKGKFKKDPEPYGAEAYDATSLGLRAIETAIKETGGKMPSREAVAVAIRKTKYEGVTGHIEFDSKGDRKKAGYFILKVASDDPAKWGENPLVKQLQIDPPPLKK
jgi:branched-chain amino acid transport system substrate-binding protein